MKLTLDQFERLVLKLANQSPARYFKHWNHPTETPWLMAVAVDLRCERRESVTRLMKELEERGLRFRYLDARKCHFFTVERDVEAERAGTWNTASVLPPLRRAVLVLTKEKWVPFVGYVKDNGDGPYWVVPGHGGTVEWWTDVVPSPLPDAAKERFRREYERSGTPPV